jgi:L,D-peptidoglycan transpeptidase YkuD (ErfK/YbiS/YcfS/YnhG family)
MAGTRQDTVNRAFGPGRALVRRSATDPRRGLLVAGGLVAPCALGRGGIRGLKREGDGATPAGRHAIVAVLYRADREPRPATRIPAAPLRPDSGWCDDPADRRYNRPVRLPYPGRHERMWRDDRLYDVVVVLDYNLAMPARGAGSAIFLHIATPAFSPTAGCIAVAPDVMRRLLARLGPGAVVEIR